jgi:hypothetical protein
MASSVRARRDPCGVNVRRRRFLLRAIGGAALLLAIAGSVTDVTITHFWDRNAMLTGILADVLVLLVGVAVVNEYLDIRSTDRWRTVAYYATVELLYASRDTWVKLAHVLNLHEGEDLSIPDLSQRILAEDTPALLLSRAAHVLADPDQRAHLTDVVVEVSDETRETLTNWAPIMITTATSAEAINRFTHLHGRLMRLRFVLQETVEGHPMTQIEIGDDEWAARRVATIVRLSAQLAVDYRAESLQIVPLDEWSDDDFVPA